MMSQQEASESAPVVTDSQAQSAEAAPGPARSPVRKLGAGWRLLLPLLLASVLSLLLLVVMFPGAATQRTLAFDSSPLVELPAFLSPPGGGINPFDDRGSMAPPEAPL